MLYIRPSEVRSPKAYWHLFAVLVDRGPGDCAFALGEWNGKPRIGFRWNGTRENPIGNPQSRGLPTWTMLDPEFHEKVIAWLPDEKKAMAREFLGTGLMFDGVTLSGDSRFVVLPDLHRSPMVIVKVACDALRRAVDHTELSPEDCRLLVDRNRDLLAEVALPMLAEKRYTASDDGRRWIVEVDAENIAKFAKSATVGVIQVEAMRRMFQDRPSV